MTTLFIVTSLVLILAYWLFYRKINSLQKQNKMTLTIGIVWLLFCAGTGILWGHTIGRVFVVSITTTEVVCKQYLIEHSDDIRLTTDDDIEFARYKVDTCLLPYWDDITIKDYGDSVYVLFWGDRDSWKWRFNLDDGFWICRIKGKQDEQDLKILNILDKLVRN